MTSPRIKQEKEQFPVQIKSRTLETHDAQICFVVHSFSNMKYVMVSDNGSTGSIIRIKPLYPFDRCSKETRMDVLFGYLPQMLMDLTTVFCRNLYKTLTMDNFDEEIVFSVCIDQKLLLERETLFSVFSFASSEFADGKSYICSTE